jgi:DNA sulfur modification protein DndE
MSTSLVDVIRLGPATKIRLTTLKRRTGIENWNVLCRWAFCLSMTDPAPAGDRHLDPGSAIEMSWKTFAGEHEALYELLVRNREEVQGELIGDMQFGDLLRAHISRGILRLTAMKSDDSLSDMLLLCRSGVELDEAR